MKTIIVCLFLTSLVVIEEAQGSKKLLKKIQEGMNIIQQELEDQGNEINSFIANATEYQTKVISCHFT